MWETKIRKTPMINLGQEFFDHWNLKDAITYGKTLKSSENLRLHNSTIEQRLSLRVPMATLRVAIRLWTRYQNELLHLDLAAVSSKANHHIVDLTIDIGNGQRSKTITQKACGTLYLKPLVRWSGSPGLGIPVTRCDGAPTAWPTKLWLNI